MESVDVGERTPDDVGGPGGELRDVDTEPCPECRTQKAADSNTVSSRKRMDGHVRRRPECRSASLVPRSRPGPNLKDAPPVGPALPLAKSRPPRGRGQQCAQRRPLRTGEACDSREPYVGPRWPCRARPRRTSSPHSRPGRPSSLVVGVGGRRGDLVTVSSSLFRRHDTPVGRGGGRVTPAVEILAASSRVPQSAEPASGAPGSTLVELVVSVDLVALGGGRQDGGSALSQRPWMSAASAPAPHRAFELRPRRRRSPP